MEKFIGKLHNSTLTHLYKAGCIFFILSVIGLHFEANAQSTVVVAAKDASSGEKANADFVCDGNSDQDEINKAMSRGKTVQLTSGTFHINGTIVGGNNILKGAGKSRTTIKMSSGLSEAISIGGSQFLLTNGSGTAKAGSSSISTTSNKSSDLSAGDYLLITSDDTFNGLREYYKKGEVVKVRSVSGTQINIASPLLDTYKDGIRIYKYNYQNNIGISDLKIINGGARSVVSDLHHANGAFYKNVDYVDPSRESRQALRMSHVINGLYDNCYIEGAMDDYKNNKYPQGYGIYLFGVEDAVIQNCRGKENKHTYELGGYWYVPVTRRITVKNSSAENDAYDPFSTHGATSDVDWIDCSVNGGYGGFRLRSPNNRVIRPVINSTVHAFGLGEYTQQGGHWNKYDGSGGNNLYIEDARVTLTNAEHFISSYDPIRKATIKGGMWKGATKSAIFTEGMECSGLVIDGVNMDLSSQKKGHVLEIDPGSGNPNVTASIKNSVFCKPATSSPLFVNHSGGNVTVSNNTIGCDFNAVPSAPAGGSPQITGLENQSLNENATVAFEVSATDPEKGSITLSTSNCPDFVQFTDLGGGKGKVTISPESGDAGVYSNLKIVAKNDKGVSGEQSFSIEVLDATPVSLPYYLNAGGKELKGGAAPWAEDKYFDGTSTVFKNTEKVENTKTPALYNSERFGENFSYHIPVEKGAYKVTLHFVETYFDAAGKRIFSVDIEDNQGSMKDYDLWKDAGKNSATTKTFQAKVSDGFLDINFSSKVNNAKICAIEIKAVSEETESENNTPVFTDIKPQAVAVNDSLTVKVSATDKDKDTLTLSTGKLPDFITFTDKKDGTGVLAIYPRPGDQGTHSITVTATDERQGVTETSIKVLVDSADRQEVNPVNAAPVFAAIKAQQLAVNEDLQLEISAEDKDNDTLVLKAVDAPGFVKLTDNGNGTGLLAIQPDLHEAGVYQIVLQVADNAGQSDTTSFQLVVSDIEVQQPDTASGEYLYRVNAGGDLIANSTMDWKPDSRNTPSGFLNAQAINNGISSTSSEITLDNSVPAGIPEALFRTERYNASQTEPTMTWDFPVEKGKTVEVRLYFAELFFNKAEERIFDVMLEGNKEIANFDIFKEAGHNTGVMKTFTVESDGNIDIDLVRIKQNPCIMGIEIISLEYPETVHSTGLIKGFTLIDADNQKAVGPLGDGDVINLETVGTDQLNIRLDLNTPFKGSVAFNLNQGSLKWRENQAPFSMRGDTEGTYKAWTAKEGVYELIVTCFSQKNSTGEVLDTDTIRFSVQGSASLQQVMSSSKKGVILYPNPVRDVATISFADEAQGEVSLEIADQFGKTIFQEIYSLNAHEKQIKLDLHNLYPGDYFLKINSQKVDDKVIRLLKGE